MLWYEIDLRILRETAAVSATKGLEREICNCIAQNRDVIEKALNAVGEEDVKRKLRIAFTIEDH